jgi:hypothetical protein
MPAIKVKYVGQVYEDNFEAQASLPASIRAAVAAASERAGVGPLKVWRVMRGTEGLNCCAN